MPSEAVENIGRLHLLPVASTGTGPFPCGRRVDPRPSVVACNSRFVLLRIRAISPASFGAVLPLRTHQPVRWRTKRFTAFHAICRHRHGDGLPTSF